MMEMHWMDSRNEVELNEKEYYSQRYLLYFWV